jgi:predicted RNA binding protein YcfA (HicA-like mRNA interferase family)
MSKREKRIARLRSRPKDFTWQELIDVLSDAGYKGFCRGGSHYVFHHPVAMPFAMSKTHPAGILKAYQVKLAIEVLDQLETINKEAIDDSNTQLQGIRRLH